MTNTDGTMPTHRSAADRAAALDDAVEVIRSEERLDVRTVSVPVKRVRVRKVIVSEERTVTVTVRREELRVDEVPVDPSEVLGTGGPLDPSSGPEGDVEMVLHEEQIIVTTQVVPVQRVRAVKQVVTVQTPVTEAVRHEVVDTVTDGPTASA